MAAYETMALTVDVGATVAVDMVAVQIDQVAAGSVDCNIVAVDY